MRPKSTDREKRSVIRSTLFSTLVRVCIAAALFCCGLRRQPGFMKTVLLVLAAVNLIIVPFTFAVLRQRLREIEEGELDEARKY